MGKDKILHFAICTLCAFVIALLFSFVADLWVALLAAFVATLLLGVGKEYGDSKASGNHWCWYDLIADVTGAVIGCCIALVLVIILGG